jgi:NAD(P)-dependent dehydrogenase (short-subunit alcohol dehydrogenase family)
MSRFDGEIVLVTGSSRGYGRAMGRAMAAEGATVILNSHQNSADGRAAAREICAAGGAAVYVPADIGKEEDVRRLADVVTQRFGRIDVLVHNAARGFERPVEMTTWSEFEEAMRVNTYGLIALARHFRPIFQPGGRFVYVSSLGAELALTGYGAIGATKAASEAVIRSLALEWAPQIRANAVRPNIIPTVSLRSFTWSDALWEVFSQESPLGVRDLKELISAALWLCSRDSEYVTGQVIAVDGGFSATMCRPALLPRGTGASGRPRDVTALAPGRSTEV